MKSLYLGTAVAAASVLAGYLWLAKPWSSGPKEDEEELIEEFKPSFSRQTCPCPCDGLPCECGVCCLGGVCKASNGSDKPKPCPPSCCPTTTCGTDCCLEGCAPDCCQSSCGPACCPKECGTDCCLDGCGPLSSSETCCGTSTSKTHEASGCKPGCNCGCEGCTCGSGGPCPPCCDLNGEAPVTEDPLVKSKDDDLIDL